jgi:RNA polymerase sigma factor (sigma-70 family)
LDSLKEPQKLRAWLCGIARRTTANALRRQQREPAQAAEPLDHAAEFPAPEPLPAEQAIRREEEALLWRSLERIPAAYREPLILFYREDQSVERVAEALALSNDTVRQRLSRGRKLLEQHVASFVEGALRQSAPGHSFTASVMTALPAQIGAASLVSAGATTAKSGAVKLAGLWTGLSALACFLPGVIGGYQGYKLEMAHAGSEEARRAIRRFYRILAAEVVIPTLLLFLPFALSGLAASHPALFRFMVVLATLSWIPVALIIMALVARKVMTPVPEGAVSVAPLEYRSKATFLGLPLVHVRLGGAGTGRRGPVLAWIAVGNFAVGALFAFGGIAAAPVCFGGFALGAVAYGGFGFGIWVMGGFVIGCWAVGGCCTALLGSAGGLAMAGQFAQGGIALAPHANDAAARAYFSSHVFFRGAFSLATTWLWPTFIVAMIPSVILALRARFKNRAR